MFHANTKEALSVRREQEAKRMIEDCTTVTSVSNEDNVGATVKRYVTHLDRFNASDWDNYMLTNLLIRVMENSQSEDKILTEIHLHMKSVQVNPGSAIDNDCLTTYNLLRIIKDVEDVKVTLNVDSIFGVRQLPLIDLFKDVTFGDDAVFVTGKPKYYFISTTRTDSEVSMETNKQFLSRYMSIMENSRFKNNLSTLFNAECILYKKDELKTIGLEG